MNTAAAPAHVVVVGTSAGGVEALKELVGQLRQDMDATFFIVMHLSQRGIGQYLLNSLQQQTDLPCKLAEEGDPLLKGHIYIAPSEKHLLVSKEGVKLGLGPHESRWKPSIDVLFRSAAAAFNSNTIGVILTGYLNDGTSGMLSIKSSGGTCIVQDPNEAAFPDMPLSVLNHMKVDHCISLTQMGEVLEEVLQQVKKETPVPPEIKKEAAIAERVATGMEEVVPLGEPTVYTCPDCGGVLTAIQQQTYTRYKCHTGHSFSSDDLLIRQKQDLESTLWIALRSLEERKTLLRSLESQHLKRGLQRSAKGYTTKIEELKVHIDRLKQLLFSTQKEAEF